MSTFAPSQLIATEGCHILLSPLCSIENVEELGGFLSETSGKRPLNLILSILCIHVESLLPCPNSESNMDAQDSQD